MKTSKVTPVIVETSAGRFLLRDFRPPIRLRTSPRKTKNKLRKEMKRLSENSLIFSASKRKQKKQINFDNNKEQEENDSISLIILNDEQGNDLTEEELRNKKLNLCFVNPRDRRALIFSPRSSRLTFVGVFSLTQLCGRPACLHGFTLQLSRCYSVYNFSSQSLISIETSSSYSKSTFHESQIRFLFDNYHIHLPLSEIYIELIQKLAKFHQGLSVFLIEQLEIPWIESIKQLNKTHLLNQWLFNNDNQQTDNKDTIQQLWPGMISFKNNYYRSIVYSNEIRSTTNEIISRLLIKPNNNRLIVFVCGAKDSGKSTYLRYLINRCLSKTKILPRITFLDCDLGQSEFTPSGSISLIDNITEPLFGPSASHLKQPYKSFYFGNIKVDNDQILNYLNYVKLCYDSIRNQQNDLLLVNTMGWGADSGLLIIKELIDLIQPAIVIQLRSSNPYFRHTMPEINQQWSANGPISTIYRQMNQIPLNFSYLNYEYRLLLTDISQHSHGKSNLTRQACLWSYFSQLEKTNTILRPLIDYIDHIEIFKFQKIGIGLMHRQIEAKYLFEVLNGSMVGLCQVENDMLYFPSSSLPAFIDERANVQCFGFGLIRSIDMIHGEIHVIIPDINLPKTMINALIKGYDECPDEFYFMSLDRWRGSMPPYVTGIFNSTM